MSVLATTATLLAGGILGAALTHRWAAARVVEAQRRAVASAVQFAANGGAWHSLNATANATRRELNVLASRERSITYRETEAVARQAYLDQLGLDTVGALAVLAEAEHHAATRPTLVVDLDAEPAPMFASLLTSMHHTPAWLSDANIAGLIDTVVGSTAPPTDDPPTDDDTADHLGPAETIDDTPAETDTPPPSAELLAMRLAVQLAKRPLPADAYAVPAVR